MASKKWLEIQIELYKGRVAEEKNIDAKNFCQHELDGLRRRLKNFDKPHSPISENYKFQARFTGNFYSLS
ncbi:MAG: hypothetical protein ACEQSR_03835 [Candidatus Methylacidiphilales bacterium]